MGGLIGVKDENAPYILKVKANCISFEGFYTYGGLNGRDLEALAVGLYEGLDEDWLRYRLGTMSYIGECLDDLLVHVRHLPAAVVSVCGLLDGGVAQHSAKDQPASAESDCPRCVLRCIVEGACQGRAFIEVKSVVYAGSQRPG